MKDINVYIENVFSGFDNERDEVLKFKEELKENMTMKYNDFLKKGMSNDEAFGKVIREFGDISEIEEELSEFLVDKNLETVKNKKMDHLETAIWMLGLSIYIYTGMIYEVWAVNWIIFLIIIGLIELIKYSKKK